MAKVTVGKGCLFQHFARKWFGLPVQKVCLSSSSTWLQSVSSPQLPPPLPNPEQDKKPSSWSFNTVTPYTEFTNYEEVKLSTIFEWLDKQEKKKRLKDQRFDRRRYDALGPDLYAANFVVNIKGRIKAIGFSNWFYLDAAKFSQLPHKRIDNFFVEGIDLSSAELIYEGYENFVNMDHVRYMCVKDNTFFDDFCLTQLVRFRHTLEFLDLNKCPKITERGLAWLHNLENLKCLRLENLNGVQYPEFMLFWIQDMLPNCRVLGTIASPMLDEQRQINSSHTKDIQNIEVKEVS